MPNFKRVLHLLLLIFLISFSGSLWAQREIPPKPEGRDQTSVYDEADLLNSSEEAQLRQKLINYADTTSTQIVIATIQSLQGEYPGTYAPEWAQKWGIGQSKEDNGLLILVAQKEHKIWITTGYGLEEYLTDARTKQIIEQIILPEFRNNDFYAGLDKGTTAIFQVLDGTFKGVPQHKGKPGGIPSRLIILFIIFIIIVISLSRGNKGGGRGGRRGRSTLMDAIILSSLGRGTFGGGGFGGGSSGGGFGGGG
ncbi:MAG: TPM domain-containing protein, partial [Salegentibacter sp.]